MLTPQYKPHVTESLQAMAGSFLPPRRIGCNSNTTAKRLETDAAEQKALIMPFVAIS
jgi:hypothetical protein